MVTTTDKDAPVSIEMEIPYGNVSNELINQTASVEPYAMSWLTRAGLIALSISLSSSSFTITGPNSSIGYMAAEYPDQAHKASWISNTPILCVIALKGIFGASSGRYGKKWFLLGGGTVALIGSIIGAYATSINMIIIGSGLVGIGGAALNQALPAGMEIIAAKYRTAEVALMATINGSLGIIGRTAVCESHRVQIIYSTSDWQTSQFQLVCSTTWVGVGDIKSKRSSTVIIGVITTSVFYHQPPTRFREGQNFVDILKSIHFIGISLLSTGAVLLTLALTWGGVQYDWSSAHVVPFLVIGPLVLIVFGIYEWKSRVDGVLHHDFFVSRAFPIFLFYGFVDGVILYSTSVFIPSESRHVYYNKPLSVARGLIVFSATLLAGFLLAGYMTTKMKRFGSPLTFFSGALVLFSGLVVRANESSSAYFEGILRAVGFCVGGTEIIPQGAIGLIVPSYLIATASMVFITCRVLGGIMGIAIFIAIYSNKAAVTIPENVIPVLAKARIPSDEYATIINIVVSAPVALVNIPALSTSTIAEIIAASHKGASQSYRYLWYCIMAAAVALFALSFLIKDAPHKMDNQVESALERAPPKASTTSKEREV